MTEAIYKVGDILEFKSSQYFPACMYNISGPFRALIIRVDNPGYEYVMYRLLLFSKECNNFINRYMSILQKDIITNAKRIGHIDISLLRFEEQEEPDYAMFFMAATITQAADLRNELDKIKKENEELKAERNEANHEISRLRTVVGGLNNIIDDLNASKSEISDLFYSLKNALQTNDILEGVNKLKEENERLSNENKNLKAMNDELRSSWIECCTSCKQTEENKKLMDDNAKLSLKLYDANEKAHKLEEENGKLTQKISCADKLLAEAANRLYQGRAHLNISAHN